MIKIRVLNKYRILLNEEGFSLVEIFVAITIATLIIGFALGLYLYGQDFFLRWQNRFYLQNELHSISQGIYEDIFKADQIVNVDSYEIVFERVNEKEKSYKVVKDTLYKGDKVLVYPPVSLVSFRLSSSGESNEKREMTITESQNKINFISFTLILTNGLDTLGITRAIYLRKPANWNILKKK